MVRAEQQEPATVRLVATGEYDHRIGFQAEEHKLGKYAKRVLRRYFKFGGTLYDTRLFPQVRRELRDINNLHVDVSEQAEKAYQDYVDNRTLEIWSAGGEIFAEVRGHCFRKGQEVLERFLDGSRLAEPMEVWPLGDHWRARGGTVELQESFGAMARDWAETRVTLGSSPEFFRQVQVWYSPAALEKQLREVVGGYSDAFDTMSDPRELDDFSSALRKRGATVHVLDDAGPVRDYWDRVADTSVIDRLYSEEIHEPAPDVGGFEERLEDDDKALFFGRLYPFQELGVSFLHAAESALLADDMGLGKTVQAIAAALLLMAEDKVESALVVCPASVKRQWGREIERFSPADPVVVDGGPDQREETYAEDYRFMVLNYALLWRDIDMLTDDADPDLVILDEAQRIKNFRTKTSEAAFELPHDYAFVLTGTPLENELMELFNVMKFVDERALGSSALRFRDRYVVLDRFGGIQGYQRVSEVTRKISAVTLRRTREETLDELPELVEQYVWVDFGAEQRKVYQKFDQQAGELPDDASDWSAEQLESALTSVLRLREACDSAELIEDAESDAAAKLNELEVLLGEQVDELGRQAIVFTQWSRMAEILEREISEWDYATALLTGDTSQSRRDAEIERFMKGDARVFISTDAGGTGLNLQAASLVINYDLPFNPAKVNQRIARAHRIGQESSVLAVNLCVTGTIEERLVSILERRKSLFEEVFGSLEDEGELAISRFSGEDRELIAELLRGT